MVVPEYQDAKSDDSMITFQKVPEILPNTRQAGGQDIVPTVTRRIIVDIREFRSDLPCLIHRRGIEVVPVTITVCFQTAFYSIHGLSIIFYYFFFIRSATTF